MEQSAPEGWVKLWRKIMVHEVWTEMPKSCLQVFLYCLMMASRRPAHVEFEGRRVSVPTGGFPTSTRRIAEETNTGRQQVRIALDKLKATHLIRLSATQHYTIITVTKWDAYQSVNAEGNPRKSVDGNPGVGPKEPTGGSETTHRPPADTLTRARPERRGERRIKPPGGPPLRNSASPNGRGSAPDPPHGSIVVISPEQAHADDAYAEFCRLHGGTVTDRTRRTWDRIMTGHPELIALCLSNTPDWMRTKRYGDGVVPAGTYLRDGAWRKAPPTASTHQRGNSKGTDWDLVARLAFGERKS